ncbi:MAG TPA: cyclase family protein [Streptosporangiaceae bacterium]|jgi:kynurenine formamidase
MAAETWPGRRPGGPALVSALGLVRRGRLWELSHELFEGMPSHPNHPPFSMKIVQRHGDRLRDGGYSAANELITMSGHHGTHIDALGHVSVNGLLYGDVRVADVQAGTGGLTARHVAELPPFIGRAVVADVPGSQGRDQLDPGEEISVADLEHALAGHGASVEPGDAVLIRTGWGARWPDQERFFPAGGDQPGPGEAAARWLAGQQVSAVGSDTMAFECALAARNAMPAHRLLLREAGIPILEKLRLDDIAAAGVTVCVLIVAPLLLRGATGSPVRAVALD